MPRPTSRQVITRYPLLVRLGASLACLLLLFSMARGPVHPWTVVVALGAFCLTGAVLAYRVQINNREVRIRYLPFYTKCTQLRDVTHLLEERTIVLATPIARIPLWGLSSKDREELFEIFPSHLEFAPSKSSDQSDSAQVIRRYLRRTIYLAIGFAMTASFSIPFLRGNPWNKYVDTVGKYIFFTCL